PGGPFAAVIVKDGQVIGESYNRVVADNDATAHGEVSAIRNACQNLGTFDLGGATMYTAGECCPMCYAAAWWARIGEIYYAASMLDAQQYGDFDDIPITESFKLPNDQRKVPMRQLLRDDMVK